MDDQIFLLKKHQSLMICGIYFLFDHGELVYIGQSINIQSRVASHLPYKKFDSYSFIEIDKEYLDEVEFDYIAKYKPKYNKTRATDVINRYRGDNSALADLIGSIREGHK